MNWAGAALDKLLSDSIGQFAGTAPIRPMPSSRENLIKRSEPMGGLDRLANVIHSNHAKADVRADALADKLEAAYKKVDSVMTAYDAHADAKFKEAEDAEAALLRISNLPPPSGG